MTVSPKMAIPITLNAEPEDQSVIEKFQGSNRSYRREFLCLRFPFGIFGHEQMSKVVGAIFGAVALIVLAFCYDDTNSQARSKARKERQELGEKYRKPDS